jgi:cobalt/nickel transport system permease protein
LFYNLLGLEVLFYTFPLGNSIQILIAEGFLPVQWAVFWWVVALPFFLFGLRSLSRITKEHPDKLLINNHP